MPLSDADIVQSNSGSGTTTSFDATLGAGTTAGNTLILVLGAGGSISVNTPAGFTRASPTSAGNAQVHQHRKSNVAGGETAWTITTLSAGPVSWRIYEIQGLDPDSPVDATPTATNAAASTATLDTFGSGTNPRSTAYDAVVVAAHCAYIATTSPPTIDSHTQGFTEDAEVSTVEGARSITLSVSLLFTQQLVTPEPAATRSDGAVGNIAATHVVYAAAGAGRAPNVAVLFGGEIRTAAGLNTGTLGNAPFDDLVGSPTVGNNAANARTGDGYLEISATAAAEYVGWTNTGALVHISPPSPTALVTCFAWRSPTALPAGNAEICTVGDTVLRYVSASQNLGLKVGAGAEQLSASTVAADTWYLIDLRYDVAAATRKADWRIDGVSQTQATHSSGTIGGIWFGLVSRRDRDLPVRRHRGHQAGPAFPRSATSASTACRRRAGHHLAAPRPTSRRSPPTAPSPRGTTPPPRARSTTSPPRSARRRTGSPKTPSPPATTWRSRSRPAQPSPTRRSAAVRCMCAGGRPATTAATIGFRGYDGTTETPWPRSPTPRSTTRPRPRRGCAAWLGGCRRHRRSGPKRSSTRLVGRLGFSGDAAPDIGAHMVMAEVAVQPTATQTLFGDLATQTSDPVSGGVQAVTVDTTVTAQPADLTYEEAGSPTDGERRRRRHRDRGRSRPPTRRP